MFDCNEMFLAINQVEKSKTDNEAKKSKKEANKAKKVANKISQDDKYTQDILEERYNHYKANYIFDTDLIKRTGLPIRRQNPPEDITENIAKFIIRNYDNDPSCKWAKSIGLNGDLYSTKYLIDVPPEVKSFTSNGPSSFGPTKKFGCIYFLDMRNWLNNDLILWRVDLTHTSPAWKSLKMNKKETNQDKCDNGNRPHISWDKIYPQISEHCVKVYEGTFEAIFTLSPSP